MPSFSALITPLLAVVVLALAAAPATAASWHPVVELAPAGHVAGSDSLAVSGNATHLVYTRSGVVYQRSTNGGRTFGRPVRLATSSGAATWTALSVAARGQTVTVLYAERPSGTQSRTLYLRISLDGGATWERATRIASMTSPTGGGDGAVAVSSSGAFVAWTEPTTGDVLLRRNVVVGGGFEPPVKIGATTNRDIQNVPGALRADVALAAYANRIAVFWAPDGIAEGTTGHIVQRRSSDAGATFFREETVAADAAVVVGARPSAVSVYSTTILLAYQRRDGRGAVLRSPNAGASWSRFVATPAPSASGNPEIQDLVIGYGGTARLVYGSYVGNANGDQLWTRSSTDGGVHWAAAIRAVGPDPAFKTGANVAIAGSTTILAFGRFATPTGGVDARALY